MAHFNSLLVTGDSRFLNPINGNARNGVYYVKGTQTASTGAWTGNIPIPALYDGLTIMYYLPYAGSGNATLNLTLSNGTTTGAKNCYYSTSRLTTHYAKGCNIVMTYHPAGTISVDGTATTDDRWIANANYDTNTTTDNRINYFAGKTGAKGIWQTSLFMQDNNGTYQDICTASDGTVTSSNRTSGTTKIANTNGFRVGSPIWYTNTTYAANTNISGSGAVYSSFSLFDSRFAFNTQLVANSLTPYTPLYLVGTINSTDGLFYLDSTWWTQTPNNTTKIYVLVGACYDSTTSNCRISLYEQNKWYRYDGSKLVEVPFTDTYRSIYVENHELLPTTDKLPVGFNGHYGMLVTEGGIVYDGVTIRKTVNFTAFANTLQMSDSDNTTISTKISTKQNNTVLCTQSQFDNWLNTSFPYTDCAYIITDASNLNTTAADIPYDSTNTASVWDKMEKKVNRASTAWGTSVTLPVDRNQFIVIIGNTMFVVWFAGTNELQIRSVGDNTTASGTNSVTHNNVTFTRNGLRLTVTKSSNDAITIIG